MGGKAANDAPVVTAAHTSRTDGKVGWVLNQGRRHQMDEYQYTHARRHSRVYGEPKQLSGVIQQS